MASQTTPYVTPEEYIEAERKAEYKSEYCDGHIYAMAGAKRWHILIVTNLSREISLALKERACEVFGTDMRVQISPRGYFYPDITIVCGEPKFTDSDLDTLMNPGVIIEVFSPPTEAYNRGAKFGCYRSLPSLQEYMLISQDSQLVEHFVRSADGIWKFQATEGPGTQVTIACLNIDLALDEIYRNVKK